MKFNERIVLVLTKINKYKIGGKMYKFLDYTTLISAWILDGFRRRGSNWWMMIPLGVLSSWTMIGSEYVFLPGLPASECLLSSEYDMRVFNLLRRLDGQRVSSLRLGSRETTSWLSFVPIKDQRRRSMLCFRSSWRRFAFVPFLGILHLPLLLFQN